MSIAHGVKMASLNQSGVDALIVSEISREWSSGPLQAE